MLRFIKFFIGIVFTFIIFPPLPAQQIKEFSGDLPVFMEQFTEFMSKNISKEDEEFLDHFLELFQTDSVFYNENRKDIINVFNELLDKKARPFPDFKNYMQSLEIFRSGNISVENYENWHKSILFMLGNRKISRTKINSYFDVTISLLKNKVMYESYSVKWKSANDNYKFVFDKVPLITFGKTDLTCFANKDSIKIYETTGTYEPLEQLWHGEGGTVSWVRAGFQFDDVKAVLDEYTIDVSKSGYEAKNVKFTNVFYFDEPLLGDLEDKVKLISNPSSATYPRFSSYTKQYRIPSFYENIDYQGGFAMQGAKLLGIGTRDEKARLHIFSNDTIFMKASSVYFVFTTDRVIGRNTEISLSLKKDSIYHPDLLFTYNVARKEISLMRTDDYTSQGPYFNSYHKVDMNFDQLVWRFGEPYLTFTMSRGSTIGNANFESIDFFNMDRFNQIQLRDQVHPLVRLKRYSNKIKSDMFTAEEFANYLSLPLSNVRQLLMRMSFLGFIFYNIETDEVIIKNKLQGYLEASVGRRDYDVINFRSVTQAPLENASLDLDNFDLTINGMPQVFISDSQNVNIFPKNELIVMKRNRSFQFDGKVEAGLFTIWGNNFFFNYDTFKLNLQNIDSIAIRYVSDERDNYGFNLLYNVENLIQHVTGEILIDEPNNKSGILNYPEYPIFRSKENSYVYYDREDIQGGVYNYLDFYFELIPFTIDSLDNFSAEGLSFDGKFVSAGIFPDIEQTLKLQNDNSLGFYHNTEEEGLPLYGDKGTFINEIHLGNDGLRGNGTIEYLTSITRADTFRFFPDSMNTHAQEFLIAKQTTGAQYPKVKSNDNYVHWMPYEDQWFTYQEKGPFNMYNDTTFLTGDIILEPTGLSGTGIMDLKASLLRAKLYNYKADAFTTDSASYALNSALTKTTCLAADNINAKIDYLTETGTFRSNKDFTLVEFSENKYISELDYFIWQMKEHKVEMGEDKPKSQQELMQALAAGDDYVEGAPYTSIDPKQDSLRFYSKFASLDYKKNTIDAKFVKFIRVADAKIFPKDQEITVESTGKMRTLSESKILANTITKYHTFHHANVSIHSSKNFTGVGNYDYIDENEQIQNIHFNDIKVDTTLQTIASGQILEPDEFTLSPDFDYQGRVRLNANDKLLSFDGATRIKHNCPNIEPRWLAFETRIDPNEIIIPIPENTIDINGNKIFEGTMIASDSIHIFPTFFTPRKNYSDDYISHANGILIYDKGSGKYKIGSEDKLKDPEVTGNYLSLHRDFCELYGEGKINLDIDLGHVKLSPAGNTRHNLDNNELKLNLIVPLTFHIRDDIIGIMAFEMDSLPGTATIDLAGASYRKGIAEIVGQEEADLLFEDLSLYGNYRKLPPELTPTILFTDLKMVWNEVSRSYQSVGDIGVGHILDKQVNKYFTGFIEIVRRRSGDKMDIYLQVDEDHWYYFGYTRGVMQVLSSNKEFVNLVKNLKNKERKLKVKGSRVPYNYIVSTDRKFRLFLRRWQDILAGEQGEVSEE